MADRIRWHRAARASAGWDTIEEQFDLAGAMAVADGHDVLLVECLTLWVNNLMHRAGQQGGRLDEDDLAGRCRQLLAVCRGRPGTVIFVTNEVGLGIVPDNPLARAYRDRVGQCNQEIAAGADAVTLVCCGIPVHVKGV